MHSPSTRTHPDSNVFPLTRPNIVQITRFISLTLATTSTQASLVFILTPNLLLGLVLVLLRQIVHIEHRASPILVLGDYDYLVHELHAICSKYSWGPDGCMRRNVCNE